MNKFDDERGIVWFVKYQDEITTVTLYITSWWRKLLFAVGINCYYKETEISAKGQGIIWQMEHYPVEPTRLTIERFEEFIKDYIKEYPLTPNECIETKPE